ncbi:Os02g0248400 [Oryza sativa Japonica Group]|uniref:Os02g0248400 protein n=1 Tax=Oryza sativa subsp. japonica TaxID=39947 RepID=A0A0P0VH32_ORYSJ|nr:Os02g0248400 [Oryza sativa Japonica Group]
MNTLLFLHIYTGGKASSAGGDVSAAVVSSMATSRGGERSHRHIGQVRCECSHMSMHSTWNRCLHDGISRTISPACSSSRHIEHGSPFPASRSPPPLSPYATRRVHW